MATNVPREYVRDLRNLLYIWGRHGEADAITAWQKAGNPRNLPPGKPFPEFARVVRGRVQYVGSVKGWTSSAYLGLATKLEKVDPDFVLRHEAPATAQEQRRAVRLFTEGKSDVHHMLAAQRWFHQRGEFTELELITDPGSARDGDANLLRYCEGLALTLQPTPCVCLFDSDNEDLLEKAAGLKGWRDWKNGVVAVALVDDEGGRACIETLYDESVRKIEDDEGRRLFLMSEFDERTGIHHSRSFNTPHPDRRRLVPEGVFRVSDGESVGLTKANFGKAIHDGMGDFAAVSFDGFRPTFEAIRVALAKVVPLDRSD
jgi:RNA-directed DNA polymerase